MSRTGKQKNPLSFILRYILLPITVLGFAVVLSRCGPGGQTPAPPYKGPTLEGSYKVTFNKSLGTLTFQDLVPPNVTPSAGGTGFSVSIVPAAPAGYSGGVISQSVQIQNNTTSLLTGVVITVQSISGSATAALTDYGNNAWDQNPTAGPWTWWIKGSGTNSDGSPNYGIPAGATSNAKTIAFNSTSSFTGYIYVWAFCPSGVIVDRSTGVPGNAVPNAFVMLGLSPGDTAYWAENLQPSGTVVNYVAATDSQGYFALPITAVAGTTITYTAGALGSGSGINAQYDNVTLWGTAMPNVVLPLRPRLIYSSYIGAGTSAGNANVTNPAGTTSGACVTTGFQIAAFLPAMGIEDLINLSLNSLFGPTRNLSIIGGTNCGAADLTTSMGMPSNLIVPAQNVNGVAVYTTTSGTTAGLNLRTLGTTTNGKDFDFPIPGGIAAGSPGLVVAGIFGNLPVAQLNGLTYAVNNGNPSGLLGVIPYVTWNAFGYSRNWLTPATGSLQLPAADDYISGTTSTYSLALNSTTNILGPSDPSQTYQIIAVPGVAFTNALSSFQLGFQSLAMGSTGDTSIGLNYLPTSNAIFPANTDAKILPTAFILDINSVNANFSASTILTDRTGYATLPGTLTHQFNDWYKLMDINWPTINPNDRNISWSDATSTNSNAGFSPTAPSISYVLIGYASPVSYTDVYGTARSLDVNAAQWEILAPGPEVAGGPFTGVIVPTLPSAISSLGLVSQPANSRHYTVNILQGRARTAVDGPMYVWDTNNDLSYVAQADFLGTMDAFSLTKFHVGGGWIESPANGTYSAPTTAAVAYINAYNWNIVSGGTPTTLRGCFWVQNNANGASYSMAGCTAGGGCPTLTPTIANGYAKFTATLTYDAGTYNAITFTPYNTTAATSPGGGAPACQQVGDSTTIYVHP